MNSDKVAIRNGRFYDLTEANLLHSTRAQPVGDWDGYLFHQSVRIWFLGDDLFCAIHYHEGQHRGGFLGLTPRGNIDATFLNPGLPVFMSGEQAFHRLCDYMEPVVARAVVETCWLKDRKE